MVEGNTLPIAFNSVSLLSVIEYSGNHLWDSIVSIIVSPSAIMSSFSCCGMIVATTMPVPEESSQSRKHREIHLGRAIYVIHESNVMSLPYLIISSF